MLHLVKNYWTPFSDKRNRPLLWAIVVCFFIGLFEISAPLDDVMRVARNKVRAHEASGQIVVVNVDGPTVAARGEWPWPRDKVADLAQKLDAAGAERIAFDHAFVPTGQQDKDEELAEAFAALRNKPIIGASFEKDPVTQERRFQKPAVALAKVSITAATPIYFNGFGHAWMTQHEIMAEGEAFPSFAAALANHSKDGGRLFIDYAINPASIPQISALQVLDNGTGQSLAGKTVFVMTGRSIASVPGSEPIPISLLHVLAAETIRGGEQSIIGWLPPFAMSLAAAVVIWIARRRWSVVAVLISVSAAGFAPLFLESTRIYVDVGPALLVVASIVTIRGWRSYRRGDARVNQLTGLPNLLALREKKIGKGDSVVAVRVKNYAELNSALAQNEEILAKQIAQRLTAGGLTPLFHGDDGIFCWIASAQDSAELTDQLEAMHSFFLLPVAVGNWQVDVSVSFGIDNGQSADASSRFAAALVAADEAAAAGHRWKFYDPARLDEAEWNMSLLGRLDTAIESGEVWVAYQPKLDLHSDTITGAEALVRWTHPDRGAISPEEFVSVAEANGRIDKLTYFVLDQALALVATTGNRLSVSVNLSAQMFGRKDFVTRLEDMLGQHKVTPEMLIIEITESAAVESEEEMFATVNALTALGVAVSIDDYGTGYCTLEYLKKINATELKIDRGFVGAMDRNRSDRVLVNATIELAHSLGHTVVAEGVETQEALDLLHSMGCDRVQGFLISRPVPRDEFLAFVADRQTKRAA